MDTTTNDVEMANQLGFAYGLAEEFVGPPTYIRHLMQQDPDFLDMRKQRLATGDTVVPRRSLEDTQSLLHSIVTRLQRFQNIDHLIGLHKSQETTRTK